MSRPYPARLAVFLVLILAAMGGVSIAKGGLYLAKHEGDTMHLLQIVLRMADGQWPHLDFMTPIGVLATAPIALFAAFGAGVGHAFIYAQVLVGLILLPAAWWVGVSRLGGWLGYLFGAVIVTFATALLHGETESSVSISMHYNRWAWAAAYLALALAILPPKGRARPLPDGVVVGLAFAVMALIKVTYFAAFAVPVVVAFALRKEWRTLGVALLAGLAVAALVTVLAGPEFWLAYLRDLATVSVSEFRSQPGEDFTFTVAAPAKLGGSLMALVAVILMRQGGRANEGLVLLLAVPGFFYVTYQNFGNDPQWLMLLAIVLFALLPAESLRNGMGWDMRQAFTLTAVATLAFAAPSFLNLAYSPFRHFGAKPAKFAAMLPRGGRNADIYTVGIRAYTLDMKGPLEAPGAGLEVWDEKAEREDYGSLNGETLPRCELDMGVTTWFDAIARDLEAQGFGGRRIFTADILSSLWLFGDFPPLAHAAPWYYGGLAGFEDAEFVMVPLCPLSPKLRARILNDIGKTGTVLEEVDRRPLYILLAKKAP